MKILSLNQISCRQSDIVFGWSGLRATVSFISPQAEYTPPLIYSESSRAKLVFLIEARPPSEQARLLNPGQPVEVRPLSAPSAR